MPMTPGVTSLPSPDSTASAALQAVARLLAAPTGDIRAALLAEARTLLEATAAALVEVEEAERPARASLSYGRSGHECSHRPGAGAGSGEGGIRTRDGAFRPILA